MALCCPHSTKPGLKKEARKPENTLAKRESVLLNIIALKNQTVNALSEKGNLRITLESYSICITDADLYMPIEEAKAPLFVLLASVLIECYNEIMKEVRI